MNNTSYHYRSPKQEYQSINSSTLTEVLSTEYKDYHLDLVCLSIHALICIFIHSLINSFAITDVGC